MSNYNIEIDLLKLKGAKVADVQGNTETRRCICVPINNRVGTVTDAYFIRDERTGEMVEVKKKGVTLVLSAFELQRKDRGQSHMIKPGFNKETFERLTDEQLREVPWIGNLKPWQKGGGGSGSDW